LRSSSSKPEVASSGFPFSIPSKSPYHNCQRNGKKNQPFLSTGQGWVKNSEYFTDGSNVLNKGGSGQASAKAQMKIKLAKEGKIRLS
jgi:hypothetical protein